LASLRRPILCLVEAARHAQVVAGGLEARGQLAPARVLAAREQAVDPLVQISGEVETELDALSLDF
jgi:hypothetical protein